MSDPRAENEFAGDPQVPDAQDNQDAIEELDVRADDSENVKGGRRSDPCEGGEIARP